MKKNDRRRSVFEEACKNIKKGDVDGLRKTLDSGLEGKSNRQREKEIQRHDGRNEPTCVNLSSQRDGSGDTLLHKVALQRSIEKIGPMVEIVIISSVDNLDGTEVNKDGDTAKDVALNKGGGRFHASEMDKAIATTLSNRSKSLANNKARDEQSRLLAGLPQCGKGESENGGGRGGL